MRTVKFNNEASIDALVRKAFRTGGARNPELVLRAKNLLTHANPHLEDLSSLKRGDVIVVPEVHGLPPSKRAEEVEVGPTRQMEHVVDSLDRLHEGAQASLQAALERARDSARKAKGRRLRNFVAENVPELLDRFGEVAPKADARAQAVQEERDQLLRALKQAQQDIEAFKAR